MKRRLTAIDLFAGAGGLSLGLRWAGFNVLAAVESDQQAADTYALNHAGVRLKVRDARGIGVSELRTGRARLDLVAGGPPCQGFSIKGQRDNAHPSNTLLVELVRIIDGVKPRAFLVENVQGLTSMSGGVFFDRLVTGLERIQLGAGCRYDVEFAVLNAAGFESVQNRRRLFIVGIDPAYRWAWPEETSKLGDLTLWDSISDLPRESVEVGRVTDYREGASPSRYAAALRGKSLNVLNHHTKRLEDLRRRRLSVLEQGQDRRHLPDALRAGGHDTKYRRLRANRPCPTLTAHMGKDLSDFIHPYEQRSLTVREAARVQGFPDTFEFMGSQASQLRQVGNAVPVTLAYALGEALVQSLSRRPRRRSDLSG